MSITLQCPFGIIDGALINLNLLTTFPVSGERQNMPSSYFVARQASHILGFETCQLIYKSYWSKGELRCETIAIVFTYGFHRRRNNT